MYWECKWIMTPYTLLSEGQHAPALWSFAFTLQLIADHVKFNSHFPSVGSSPLVFTLSVVLPVYLI